MSSTQRNERLWFLHRGCSGQHFILGNPHTFPVRMLGWCVAKDRSFFFSKAEVEESSPEANAWVEGFLAGNEPEPPANAEGDVNFESEEYRAWLVQVEAFRQSGAWPKRAQTARDENA